MVAHAVVHVMAADVVMVVAVVTVAIANVVVMVTPAVMIAVEAVTLLLANVVLEITSVVTVAQLKVVATVVADHVANLLYVKKINKLKCCLRHLCMISYEQVELSYY